MFSKGSMIGEICKHNCRFSRPGILAKAICQDTKTYQNKLLFYTPWSNATLFLKIN